MMVRTGTIADDIIKTEPELPVRGRAMDVFEAVNSRIACRHFLDKPVEPNILRELIEGAARAASSSNLQPWNVYAVTGEPLKEIKRQAAEAIEQKDWRTFETEYLDFPEKLWEPYLRRSFDFGAQLYGALGINREDRAGRLEQIKRNFRFFEAPVGLFITIDRRLGPGQWADLGGYVNALAFLARGYGLDTCPQVLWIRLYKIVGAFLKFPAEQMLYCGMGIGHCDRSHPVNSLRTTRAELREFCKFFGFD
jgi:nitroreductase